MSTNPTLCIDAARKALSLFQLEPSFANSNFKAAYDKSKVPDIACEVISAMCHVVDAYCGKEGVPDALKVKFKDRLQTETIRNHAVDQTVPALCQHMWTLPCYLDPDVHSDQHVEACSILNRVLQVDPDGELDSDCWLPLATVVHSMNKLLVVRDPNGLSMPFPDGGEAYRGGGFPDDPGIKAFFRTGVKYRCARFVATSFSFTTARDAFMIPRHAPHKAVMWTVEVDRRGKTELADRCKNGSFVTNSATLGESEYLFSPYSTFEVLEANFTTLGTAGDPYTVRVRAMIDNSKEDEGLPLAPWA
jgi:hypothetical protein